MENKYVLSEKMLRFCLTHTKKHRARGNGFQWTPKTNGDIASTLRANGALGVTDNMYIEPDKMHIVDEWYADGCENIDDTAKKLYGHVRRLSPKESWKLMGFDGEDIDKAIQGGVSNTQLYKQAGNSIVVDVLYYIYKELYNAMPHLFDDLKVCSCFSGIGAFEKGLDKLFIDINNE